MERGNFKIQMAPLQVRFFFSFDLMLFFQLASGTVPGTIHLDLMAASLIGDPYYRYNDVDLRWVALDTWTYSRTFTVDANLFVQKQILLVAEGLDTVATITVNNKKLNMTKDQFREYIFDLKGFLIQGLKNLKPV